MADSPSDRPHNRETENENQKPPAGAHRPPRPATEPAGSEGSSDGGDTLTDPATGAPSKGG